MIRHIHFNIWKPGTTPEQIDKVFEMLGDFPSRFPEIKAFGLHRDAGLSKSVAKTTSGLRNSDFAIILDFEDEAGLELYLSREYHKNIVKTYISPIRESSARIQFIV
jgi:hypothetical protein